MKFRNFLKLLCIMIVAAFIAAATSSSAQDTAPTKKVRWFTPTPYRISFATLLASATTDYVSRYKITTHSDWVCGDNTQNPNSWSISTTDTSHVYTGQDILGTCLNNHPSSVSTVNYMYDVRQNGAFFKHNTAGTIRQGIAFDALEVGLATYLEHRKDKWPKRVGILLNFGAAAVHAENAKQDFDYLDFNGNTDRYFIYNLDSWPKPRWWGNRNSY